MRDVARAAWEQPRSLRPKVSGFWYFRGMSHRVVRHVAGSRKRIAEPVFMGGDRLSICSGISGGRETVEY